MRVLLSCVLLGAVSAFGCREPQAETEPFLEVGIPGGALQLGVHALDEGQYRDQAAAFRLADDLNLGLQWMPAENRETGDRSVRDVAMAISERVELGEREGELTHHACQAAQLEAECLTGWMNVNEARYARSGFVIRAGDSLV